MTTKWVLNLPKELGIEFTIGGAPGTGRPSVSAPSISLSVPAGAEGIVFQALYGQLQAQMTSALDAQRKGSAAPSQPPKPVQAPPPPPSAQASTPATAKLARPLPHMPPQLEHAPAVPHAPSQGIVAASLISQFSKKLEALTAVESKVTLHDAKLEAFEARLDGLEKMLARLGSAPAEDTLTPAEQNLEEMSAALAANP